MRAFRWTLLGVVLLLLLAGGGFVAIKATAASPVITSADTTTPASNDDAAILSEQSVEPGADSCTTGHQGQCPHCHDDADCTEGNPGHPPCCGPAGGGCSPSLKCLCFTGT